MHTLSTLHSEVPKSIHAIQAYAMGFPRHLPGALSVSVLLHHSKQSHVGCLNCMGDIVLHRDVHSKGPGRPSHSPDVTAEGPYVAHTLRMHFCKPGYIHMHTDICMAPQAFVTPFNQGTLCICLYISNYMCLVQTRDVSKTRKACKMALNGGMR